MTATNAQRRYVAHVLEESDRELDDAIASRSHLVGRRAELRAGTRMLLCARMVSTLDTQRHAEIERLRALRDRLEREMLVHERTLTDLADASLRWARLSGEWAGIYERERAYAAVSDADEAEF